MPRHLRRTILGPHAPLHSWGSGGGVGNPSCPDSFLRGVVLLPMTIRRCLTWRRSLANNSLDICINIINVEVSILFCSMKPDTAHSTYRLGAILGPTWAVFGPLWGSSTEFHRALTMKQLWNNYEITMMLGGGRGGRPGGA